MDSSPAILLRKIKLTETSLILSWFSANYGLIKTVAKGARAPKSRFAGLLDLFFECEVEFVRSRKSELHVLREVTLLNPFEALRCDYHRVALGSYFIELIEGVTEPDHPDPDLFDLLKRAFVFLNTQPASLKALLHFEREVARILGIQQPEVTPAIAIQRVYHKLPVARATLLKALQ